MFRKRTYTFGWQFHLSQIAYLKNSNFSLHECESFISSLKNTQLKKPRFK